MKILKITIPAADLVDGHAVYFIEVLIREYSWLIRRRYRQFYELHEKLVKKHDFDPGLVLPPKKYFGNLDADHIEKRRFALEEYLQLLIEGFNENLPEELNYFLEGNKYDVCGVTYSLAQELFNTGEDILKKEETFTLTSLQLYCITKRLELPVPTCDSHVFHGEIGNLYDFIQQLKHLKIYSQTKQIELSENVNFKCDLTLFKSLSSLEILSCDVEPFQGIYNLQQQLERLKVHHSIHLLKDILVDEEIWEQGILENVKADGSTCLSPTTNYMTWKKLKLADFNNNELPYIDESVALLPEIEELNLSRNCIESIENLQSLSELTNLDLSYNLIECLGENLNTKLGNIKQLNLSSNQLSNIDGLEKLFSLVELNLSSNQLAEVGSVLLLGQLPCLETLLLVGNQLTKESMYRVRVLSMFDDRASQIVLDGQTATSREMKKVQDIINEEQSFEIIDLPQASSSTPSKHKPGHRKIKSIDRVIALEDQSTPTKSESLTDSCASLVDENDVEFRSRVEKIRQLGGDKWLTMLGEIKNEDGSQYQTSKSKSHPKGDANSDSKISNTPESPSSEYNKRNSETFVAKVAGVEPGETGSRLHFGFTCELEELVRNKLDADNNTTSGTYMVEVESRDEDEESNHGVGHPVYEERMVGIDLSKGVILEIQIASGKTCAKHKLEDVSSVDILDIEGSYHIDIRDTYSKGLRRHKSLTSQSETTQQKDYRQVARYRMRSMADAAELFVLLYKFITKCLESPFVQRQPPSPSASQTTSSTSSVWTNHLGLSEQALKKFFEDFLRVTKEAISTADHSCHDGRDRVRNSGIHRTYHSLHADFIDAGMLNHVRSKAQEESVRMVLWAGCLPYLFSEQELPVCLVLTNVNIFLFHICQSPCLEPLSTKDMNKVLHCCYSMSVRALKQVVIGLYDQGFRLEVRNDGPRGTFTFLTRDPEKTRVFLEGLYEAFGESKDDENSLLYHRVSFDSRSTTVPSFIYPDELKLSRLRNCLSIAVADDGVKDEDLLMYSIVRELPEDSLSDVREAGILTKRLRSLIVMNSKIFLCDEDHVHWPLPTFVRANPTTPQWIVSKWRELNKIIGIDVFDLENTDYFVGCNGLSLIFDDDDSVSEEVESMATQTHISVCWNLIFRSVDEREQLQRSLAQVWKDHFAADLKVTHSKPRSLPPPPEKDTSDQYGDSFSSTTSPMGTPVESSFRKSHKRVGSDSLLLFKATTPDSMESLMNLDRKGLDGYFNQVIAQTPDNEEEKLLHVLWTGCTPYLFPTKEIQVCILLSNLFIYILAGKADELLISKKKSVKIRGKDKNCKGISYNCISTSSLQQVCVGLFDQTVRLEGVSKEETFTLITRDFNLTNAFLECLNTVLSSKTTSTTKLARRDSSTTTSIYDALTTDKTWPKSEFLHSESGVKFVYPSDDTLEILKDAIAKFSQESDLCSAIYDVTILVDLLVLHELDYCLEEPRTLIIMDTALCLCIEDHANYPLTLFATGLPDNPQYQIWDVRDVETLTRIEFSDFNSCDFTLVFSPSAPECEKNREDFDSASMGELCVITHYTPEEVRESMWKVVAPTYEEKEKSLGLICKLWFDIRGEALPVTKGKDSHVR